LEAVLLILLLEEEIGAAIDKRLIETEVGEVGSNTDDHIVRLDIDVRLSIHGFREY